MRAIIGWLSVIIVLLFMAILPTSAIDTQGLILYFDFDQAQGDEVNEVIGGEHNGALLEGAAITTEIKKYGTGAIQIKGGNEAMEVETFAELEEYQDNTYLFWIYFTDPVTGGWDQILAKHAPGSDRSPGLWVTPEGLSIHYRYNPGNLGPWGITRTGNQDGNFFELDTWYHIAGVKEGSQLIGYTDGKETAKEAVPAEHTQGPYSLFVGNSPAYGGPAAKFVMDELVVYTRAIDPKEVVEIMDGGFLSVDAKSKVTSTWGKIKRLY
jgi:hypothetical protein